MRQIAATLGATALLALATTGCASTPVSPQDFSKPRETLAAADQISSSENTQASLYKQYARENIAEADKLIEAEDYDEARFYLDRAQADAELALAFAKWQAELDELKEIDERIKELREDAAR